MGIRFVIAGSSIVDTRRYVMQSWKRYFAMYLLYVKCSSCCFHYKTLIYFSLLWPGKFDRAYIFIQGKFDTNVESAILI